jgi:hypothetical protein
MSWEYLKWRDGVGLKEYKQVFILERFCYIGIKSPVVYIFVRKNAACCFNLSALSCIV